MQVQIAMQLTPMHSKENANNKQHQTTTLCPTTKLERIDMFIKEIDQQTHHMMLRSVLLCSASLWDSTKTKYWLQS